MIIEITIGTGIGALLIWIIFRKKIKKLRKELKKSKSELKSCQVKFGKSFEHFVPFIKNFPGNREKTIFLGMPIDFISFDEDTIKFIEVKTGQSKLSPKQKYIQNQIKEERDEFKKMRYK